MTEHRAAIAATLAVLLLAAALLWSCQPQITFEPTRTRTLDGPNQPDAFNWVDADHPYEAADAPEPTPLAIAPLPLPSDTTFELNDSRITDPAAVNASMAPLVAAVTTGPDRQLLIQAWSSADGPEPLNHRLSLARGEAVRSAAVALGVPAERVRVIAHGERNLPDPDNPDAATNRVVVVSAVDTSASR